jgi:hypothetical protein
MATSPCFGSETLYPGLVGSTFLGGKDSDYLYATATDLSGNVYVAGSSGSVGYPSTPGVYQGNKLGGLDVVITKLAPDGYTILWSGFLGGIGDDEARAIAVGDQGEIYLCGTTTSPDFPMAANPFDDSHSGGPHDGFVAKLSADGAQLLYSTFLGGGGTDVPRAIALDPSGAVVIAGFTGSNDYPTTTGVVKESRTPVFPDGADGFVTKLNPSGAGLIYSTYLGTNTGTDIIYGLALDSAGRVTVTGRTLSPGFPTTPGAYDRSFGGEWDGFVTRLHQDATAYEFSTLWGGAGDDELHGVAIDGAGDVYVCGHTSSVTLGLPPGAYQAVYGGGDHDGLIGKFSADGTSLLFGTFLGGGGDDLAHDLALSSAGDICLTGSTSSADFPVVGGGFPSSGAPGFDSYAAWVTLDGSQLDYSGYLGGDGSDEGRSVVLRADGHTVVAGFTDSGNFPLIPNAAAGNRPKDDGIDGFVSILDLAEPQPVSVASGLSTGLRLLAPTPNPFLSKTAIRFTLARSARTAVRIIDPRGRIIRQLIDQELTSGPHTLTWTGTDDRGIAVPPGVYWVEVISSNQRARRTTVLLR